MLYKKTMTLQSLSLRVARVCKVKAPKRYGRCLLAIVLAALSLFGCSKQPPAVSASPSPPSSSELSQNTEATPVEIDERVRLALLSGEPKQMKEALEGGASPQGVLGIAIHLNKNTVEMVNLLLSYGADPEDSDSSGGTALMAAALAGNSEVARILLEKGAKPNARQQDGSTALNMACYFEGQADTLRVLLNSQADPNLADDQGMAPLHFACLMGDAEMVQLLLDANAQIEATTTEGITPLMLAAMEEDEGLESLQILLKAGADIEARDGEGKTALIWARDQSSKKCEEVLQEAMKQKSK